MTEIFIKKATGEEEVFDPNKLKHSLSRAGATQDIIDEIVSEIEQTLVSGMTTHAIYSRAFKILKEKNKDMAARYSLRRALLSFGPSGFPFESYLAELFKKDGYTATTGQTLKGKCVSHEIDVVAHKGDELILVEAKFHNRHGFKSDVRTSLYMKARFDDLSSELFDNRNMTKGMIITNTKFTHEAIAYAECVGIALMSWSYPAENNLQDWIERTGLHPITCLTTLSQKNKEALLEKSVVLCTDVQNNATALNEIGISGDQATSVIEEANKVCTLPLPKS
ncbi:MAG: restriction endonuclease [Candidatus Paceibacterota bacterium]